MPLEYAYKGSRPVVPWQVDWPTGAGGIPVPVVRHHSQIAQALALLHPEAARWYRADRAHAARVAGRWDRVVDMRYLTYYWVTYLAISGDPERSASWADMETPGRDPNDKAKLFRALLGSITAVTYPHGKDGSLEVRLMEEDGSWVALCPITQLRCVADTRGEAHERLIADLDGFFSDGPGLL